LECDRPAVEGDTSVRRVVFDDCVFRGTTFTSVFLRNTRDFTFTNCTIVGSMVAEDDGLLPDGWTRFIGCSINDVVADDAFASGYLIDSAAGYSVQFERCTVTAAKQRWGAFNHGQTSNCRFVAMMPTAVLGADPFLATFYSGAVTNCRFFEG